jgi:quercetin dioxygenase-like cupin family protein
MMQFGPTAHPAIETTIAEGHDLYIKQIVIPKAQTAIPQHSHKLSHCTLLTSGAVALCRDGIYIGDYEAPHMFEIPAGTKHLFVSLKNDTVLYCVHGLGSPDAVRVLEEHRIL